MSICGRMKGSFMQVSTVNGAFWGTTVKNGEGQHEAPASDALVLFWLNHQGTALVGQKIIGGQTVLRIHVCMCAQVHECGSVGAHWSSHALWKTRPSFPVVWGVLPVWSDMFGRRDHQEWTCLISATRYRVPRWDEHVHVCDVTRARPAAYQDPSWVSWLRPTVPLSPWRSPQSFLDFHHVIVRKQPGLYLPVPTNQPTIAHARVRMLSMKTLILCWRSVSVQCFHSSSHRHATWCQIRSDKSYHQVCCLWTCEGLKSPRKRARHDATWRKNPVSVD